MKIISKSVEQTLSIGKDFAKTLQGGDIVLLDGDLGAGKTHFTKGVALGLNVDGIVTSPTFTLHNIYQGEKLILNHFDFYRIERVEEAFDMGYEEYFYSDALCLVEWPEKIEELLPDDVMTITITIDSDSARTFEID